ncbi:MAG: carbohydrate kinase [Eubacteriales bacterium]|nr:carbohydrate kinase [Sarcina sp.]MDO4416830.1 carbohydrate kinase [Eubacteriales bacterium]
MGIEKNYDVTALGELLIDFTQNGQSEQGNGLFEANPGGAPCNVLAMLTKAGRRTAFIGKVGNDMFGRMLRDRAAGEGLDMSGLEMDDEIPTTLAFVEKLPNGDRDFSFYRKPGADIMLTKEEVRKHAALIEGTRIFHFGTLSMTDASIEEATQEAVSIAKQSGCLISFDPNLRPPLWKSEEMAKEKIAWGLGQCDILKISDNEITFLTGEEDFDKGIHRIIEQYQIPLVFATYGPDGSKAFYHGIEAYEKGFLNPATIETTGAGDTFCASALHHVLKYGIDGFDEAKLHELLTFANAAASLVTTRKGALCVMPTVEEVEAYIKAAGR